MKGHLAKVSSANRVLKCNRLKPVPVGGFIGILSHKTTRGVSQGITLFSRVSFFFSKNWGHLNDNELMIMIMNLYSAKTIEEYSKALYIKLKLMNK